MGQPEKPGGIDSPHPLEIHLEAVRNAVKEWYDFQAKKQSIRTADSQMNMLNMALTGIVNPDEAEEPPYPDVLDIYARMKMIGFRFWGDGLDNQPLVLYYEMQVVQSVVETYEHKASRSKYEALIKELGHAKQ